LLDQDKVVFLDQIAGTHRLAAISAVGVSFPLHCSANGKALLAAMADADIEKLKRRMKLTALTPNTITTWESLAQEIETVRRRGFAYDREENSAGISAVSVAVRGSSGEMAAISIPVPTQRFDANEPELTRALLKHTASLQQGLSR
jgi:DNA-binding IclR family transcriptional regulator